MGNGDCASTSGGTYAAETWKLSEGVNVDRVAQDDTGTWECVSQIT